MPEPTQKSRRSFLQKAPGSTIITGVPSAMVAHPKHCIETLAPVKKFIVKDQVNTR